MGREKREGEERVREREREGGEEGREREREARHCLPRNQEGWGVRCGGILGLFGDGSIREEVRRRMR